MKLNELTDNENELWMEFIILRQKSLEQQKQIDLLISLTTKLSEEIKNHRDYSEYLATNLDQSITYSEYIAEELQKVVNNVYDKDEVCNLLNGKVKDIHNLKPKKTLKPKSKKKS